MSIAHAFNVEEAERYGVNKAILLQHIRFWVSENKGKDSHTHDGKTWMYQSAADMHKHFPYWSRLKIHRMLASMEEEGLIVSGNYNKLGFDRTKWYTLTDKTQCSFETPLSVQNGTKRDVDSEQPIPDNNTDNKTDTLFEECWGMYHRKGSKKQSMRYWSKLSMDDKLSIKASILPYISSRDSMKYCLDFQGYINPRNRRWEDEVIVFKEKPKERRLSI